MARGPSGRLVIEIDPDLKRELHAVLATEGLTMKEWFLAEARRFLDSHREPDLPGIVDYRTARTARHSGEAPISKVAEAEPPSADPEPGAPTRKKKSAKY